MVRTANDASGDDLGAVMIMFMLMMMATVVILLLVMITKMIVATRSFQLRHLVDGNKDADAKEKDTRSTMKVLSLLLEMLLMRLTLAMTKMLMTFHEAIDTINMTVMTPMIRMACHHQH